MPLDVEHVYNAMSPRVRLIHGVAELKRLADNNSWQAQVRRKRDLAQTVRFEPTFAPGDYVFVERPLLTPNDAKLLAIESYSELRP